MATVNKNFKIKQGLVVEGSTATVGGFNILTENQASEDYIVGIVGGTTLVTSVESTQMEVTAGELNIKSGVFDVSGAAAAAQTAAEATASSDATSKANAAQAAAISAAASDATTKANAAKTAAEATASADATSKANAAQSAAEATASADATSKANAAQSAATTAAATDATTKANAAQAAAISAAASDATTKANAAQSAATTAAATDATSKANAAQSAAEATASADATSKANAAKTGAEATAAAANTAQENGTTPFTALNINSVAKQVAATLSAPTAGVQTAYSWAKADFRSAEFLVRVGAGADTEISKVLLTLDTADNIAITEYGIVATNVAFSTVSAAISGSNVELRVTTLNNTSVVTVMGTLIK